MIKAFLSHSSVQKDFVRALAKEVGYDLCIIDERTFEAGLPTLEEIHRALHNTALFVLLLSDSALNSTWVKTELLKAQELFENDEIQRFQPYIIDNKISHDDTRIPLWIRENRIIKKFESPILLARKIKESIRELSWEKFPNIKVRDNTFVGRNDKFDEIEEKLYSGEIGTKRAIITSGMEGAGRKTFLRFFLRRSLKYKPTYEPFLIELDARESIEDFILKTNDLLLAYSQNEILEKISRTKEEKVETAVELINLLASRNEALFIRDRGACVSPNRKVSQWFLDVVSNPRLVNQITLLVIASFRPFLSAEENFPRFIFIHIDPLNKIDQKKLFFAYSSELKVSIDENDSKFLLEKFSGLPEQIIYAVDLISKEGLPFVKNNINLVVDIGDKQVLVLLERFKNSPDAMDLLVLLAKFEFVSYDLLEQIVEFTPEVQDILQLFYAGSLYDLIGSTKQYIRLNPTVADYIVRSNLKLNKKFAERIKAISNLHLEGTTDYELKDLSAFLFNVKEYLVSHKGKNVAERYLIPSFILKTVVNLYYRGSYEDVVSLCNKALYDSIKYYEEIIREIRYWLCLALARNKDQHFMKEVRYFNGADYDFLMGFYHRFRREYDKADEFYTKALAVQPNMPKARREKVIVLLGRRRYLDALDLAKKNYLDKKTNTFHIEAYYRCLVRKHNLSPNDKEMLNELMEGIARSYDLKKQDIIAVMKAEYDYYVRRDVVSAIEKLRAAVASASSKRYALRSLIEIFDKQQNYSASQNLAIKYKAELEDFDYE